MKTLICSGTLFSEWQNLAGLRALTSSTHTSVSTELSELSEKICREQFPGSDQRHWRQFSPDKEYAGSFGEILSAVGDASVFVWADINCCLSLDFWHSTSEDSCFLLFYSSPEYELAKYLHANPYEADNIENVLQAWMVRTRAMLAFFMANRNTSLLVNVQSVDLEPAPFASLVNKHFDLAFPDMTDIAKGQSMNSILVEYLATNLLLTNELISELFDEVRSAATVICEQDKHIIDIQSRVQSMINPFLAETASIKSVTQINKELEEDLYLKQIQVSQLMEELEYYFKSSRDQGDIFTSYLSSDPLLNVARQARQSR